MTEPVQTHPTNALARLILPDLVVSGVARFAGWLVDLGQVGRGYSAEGRVRAKLMNWKYRFQLEALGRGTVINRAAQLFLAPGSSLKNNVVIMTGPRGHCRIGARSHVSHHAVLAASGG